MKAKEKKSRARKRGFKKLFRRFMFLCLFAVGIAWGILHYADVMSVLERGTTTPVETREVNDLYDTLSDYKKQGKNLIFTLNDKETDSLRVSMEKLQKIMGLKRYSIKLDLDSHTKKVPPGYINAVGDDMTIYISTHVKKRREKITVLIHELGHIYGWNLPQKYFMGFDQEKLVDTSCIYLGLGILYLNGMTDEFNMHPDGSYETSQKNFGYLKPEQFGYLLARYCKDKGISGETLKPYLNKTGWKYFQIGHKYLTKQKQAIHIPEPIKKAQAFIRNLLKKINIEPSNVVVIR